jgi:serine/threonine-protein kinase RsbW
MINNSIVKVLRIDNQIDELVKVEFFLNELAEDWSLSESLVFSLNLALEETLTNIIDYGFDDDGKHTIEIYFKKSDNELSISIIDDGYEFDPTLVADPDITVSAEDRSIGGLGIFLIRKIMDKVEYQRKENRNYLTLTKNIEP